MNENHLVAVSGLGSAANEAVGGVRGALGRVVGLGADEMEAGVPGWAWFLIGVAAGVAAGYLAHDPVKERLG